MPQGRLHELAAAFDFYGACGTAVPDEGAFDLHLRQRRSPDPCRPWLYGEEPSSFNPEASAQG